MCPWEGSGDSVSHELDRKRDAASTTTEHGNVKRRMTLQRRKPFLRAHPTQFVRSADIHPVCLRQADQMQLLQTGQTQFICILPMSASRPCPPYAKSRKLLQTFLVPLSYITNSSLGFGLH